MPVITINFPAPLSHWKPSPSGRWSVSDESRKRYHFDRKNFVVFVSAIALRRERRKASWRGWVKRILCEQQTLYKAQTICRSFPVPFGIDNTKKRRHLNNCGTHLVAGLLLEHVGRRVNVILPLIHHRVLQAKWRFVNKWTFLFYATGSS